MNKQVGNVQLMQKMNRLKVLDFIRRHPDTSRPYIAENTGLSLASITNTTSYLLDLGLIYESGAENVGRVGRKSVLLRFCSTCYDLICIYWNKKYINIAYTDLEGNTKEKIVVETEYLSLEEAIAKLNCNILSLTEQHDKARILGIGIVLPKLDQKSDDIKKAIESTTGLPVFTDKVSHIRALWYFCKKSEVLKDNMLFVDMENGINSVQFFEGTISRSASGEIGHTTVESNGEPCVCGNTGCLEAMCSPKRLFDLYKKKSEKTVSSASELDKLYSLDDKAAIYAVSECGKYLGIGLANLVNLFNPSVMVINIGDYADCPSLLKESIQELYLRANPALMQNLIIEKTNETDENIILPTAFSLCDRLFDISYSENIVE